jgi:hypothetical protein
MGCKDSPGYILDHRMCLYEISKDAQEGLLRTVLREPEPCPERDCQSFKTVHQLDLPLGPGPCDPDAEHRNGRLYSCDLTHAFDRNPRGRGFHGGTFTWADQGFLASGTLSGITNAGTHREPIFEPSCQSCREPNVMEGRFCGVVRRSADPAFLGCQVFGAYRLRLRPERDLADDEIRVGGVLEGVIVCECSPIAQASAS